MKTHAWINIAAALEQAELTGVQAGQPKPYQHETQPVVEKILFTAPGFALSLNARRRC